MATGDIIRTVHASFSHFPVPLNAEDFYSALVPGHPTRAPGKERHSCRG